MTGFLSECDLQFSQKGILVHQFAEKRCEKREAGLKKLTSTVFGMEGFIGSYRIAEHLMSPECWKRIRANQRSGLEPKLLSPT